MAFAGIVLSGTVVAIITMAGVIAWLYRSDLHRAREAASRGSDVIATAAGPIEYATAGDGIPLLSIHGAGGGGDLGLANAAELVGDGFRVIAPSRFGYLRTPVPADTSPAAQADAHAALLSALGIPAAIVLGVSAGARSAVELALRRAGPGQGPDPHRSSHVFPVQSRRCRQEPRQRARPVAGQRRCGFRLVGP
jgi:hypothetical protein